MEARRRPVSWHVGMAMIALVGAFVWPLLAGINSWMDCDDCSETDESSRGMVTGAPAEDQVGFEGLLEPGSSMQLGNVAGGSERRISMALVRESAAAPEKTDMVWTPPIGATAFRFEGMQPESALAPPFRFADVPIHDTAPAVGDVVATYSLPEADPSHVFVDSFVAMLPRGEEGISMPYTAGTQSSAGRTLTIRAVREETMFLDVLRNWYARPGYELEEDLAREIIGILAQGAGFLGVEAPAGSGSLFRIPFFMQEGSRPYLGLRDYRQSPSMVARAGARLAPEYHELLENSFPAREGMHWGALAIPKDTNVELPGDLPIPSGVWEIEGAMLVRLGAWAESCGPCMLRVVPCLRNEAFAGMTSQSVAAGVGQLHATASDEFTCLGPYTLVFNSHSPLMVHGPIQVRAKPGKQARMRFDVVSGSAVPATWSVVSDRGRTWKAYADSGSGPNFDSPLPETVTVDGMLSFWLVADMGAAESGFEVVTLRMEPVDTTADAAWKTTTVTIGTWIPPTGERKVWIPVGVHAPGAHGSQWRTDLGVLNGGAQRAEVTVTVHAADGDHELRAQVEAGGQVILPDVLGGIPLDGAGAVEVSGPSNVVVTSRTYTAVAEDATCFGGGTLGQFLDSSANGTVLAAGESAWIPQLAETKAYRTNIALTNTGSQKAHAVVHLFDATGKELGSYDVELAPGQWQQKNRPFAAVSASEVPAAFARVDISAGSGVIGYGSVVDNVTNDPTTVPMIRTDGASRTAWLPVAVHAGGAHGSRWRTDIGLLNPSRQDVTARVVLHAEGEEHTTEIVVAPGGQALVRDVLAQLSYEGAGALEVLSDEPLMVTSRTYTAIGEEAACFADGTLGQFLDSSATATVLSAGQSARIPQLMETKAYRTNIALTNTGSEEARAVVHLFDATGKELGSYDVVLAPGQWQQKNRPFAAATAGEVPAGSATVEVTQGSGVIGYASVVDNVTNDPTTLPLVP